MFGINDIKHDIKTLFKWDRTKDESLLKLSNRISQLESKEAEYKKQLEQLNWKLDNPCPYRVGQKINGQIITEVYLHWQTHQCSFIDPFKTQWMYKTVKPIKP